MTASSRAMMNIMLILALGNASAGQSSLRGAHSHPGNVAMFASGLNPLPSAYFPGQAYHGPLVPNLDIDWLAQDEDLTRHWPAAYRLPDEAAHYTPYQWAKILESAEQESADQISQVADLPASEDKQEVEKSKATFLPEDLRAKIVDPKDFGKEIPIIDLGESDEKVIEQFKYACEVVGFMQVVNHGVKVDLMDKVLNEAHSLFDLTPEQKHELKTEEQSLRGYFGPGAENLEGVGVEESKKRTDLKELFDMKGHPASQKSIGVQDPDAAQFDAETPWPSQVPNLQPIVTQYQAETFQVGKRLLRLMARALNLEEDFFEEHMKTPVATHRLLHYWPQTTDFEKQLGIGAHTDYGLLTMLFQDEVGGLQVFNAKTNEWVACPPIRGAYVVNIGDMLARWSNNKFKSTIHRVINRSDRHRYSSPLFIEPSWPTELNPQMIDPNAEASHETAGEVLVGFYKASGQLKK